MLHDAWRRGLSFASHTTAQHHAVGRFGAIHRVRVGAPSSAATSNASRAAVAVAAEEEVRLHSLERVGDCPLFRIASRLGRPWAPAAWPTSAARPNNKFSFDRMVIVAYVV